MACVCESQAANAKVIKSDIDSVWKVFRGFGPSILSFWSDAYSNVELDGEDEVNFEFFFKWGIRLIFANNYVGFFLSHE